MANCTETASQQDSEAERIYQEFWKPIVERDGVLDVAQLKRELFDYWQVMQSVPKVYSYVTGGQVSKVLTDPVTVNALADDHYGDQESFCGHCACQSCYDAKEKADHW